MPRPKDYATNAERQAAYRQRHRAKQPPREDLLAALGRSLHSRFHDAVEAGQSVLPPELLGERSDETLRNLIRYIYLHTERGQADPLFAPYASKMTSKQEGVGNRPASPRP
jgi:hypothetical protein